MGWATTLLVIFGALLVLMAIGVPIAFSFLAVNVVGAYFFWNGTAGLGQLVMSVYDSVTTFALLPVPLFVLMGELMFRSGIAGRLMDVLDSWIGRLPGRLSVMAVGGGTLFATLTGSAMAGAAMLASLLVPEMEKRGYHRSMSLGPILGSGGLAILIPPSALAVLLAAIANISVGDFLVAIIVPGILTAIAFVIYIVARCRINPSLAPAYDLPEVPLGLRLRNTLIYGLPLVVVVFLVVGLMFLGVATATESAAAGALGCFVLAWAYRGLNRRMLVESLKATLGVTVMMLMIITGSTAFSQILAFTGASGGLVDMATSLPLSPIWLVVSMQLVLMVMGCFMEPLSIMMLTIPIFFPIIQALGLSPIWFGVIMLLNMEMATITPPFGLVLFVVKGVAPAGTTLTQVYRAALPFIVCETIVMALLIAFPPLVTTLPALMVR
ncbi:MAG: TRAP transporter large permease [Gemmatimonadota bacterium]